MDESEIVTRYNYDSFVTSKFLPWMNFDNSPDLGKRAPDFPLWTLAEEETSLSAVWSSFHLTIVEFGSFT